LDIGKDTLDPRSDTETIVEAALSKLCHQDSRARSILDIGTGSGCIILALLKEIPEAKGLGIDIIPGAVLIAEHNAAKLGLQGRVNFETVDLNDFKPQEKFDLVVSNPPYVALREFEELAPEVRKYDPKIALVAGEDGLELYRQIAVKMQDFLMPTGAIFLEIGKGQAVEVNNIFFEKGFELVEIYKDLAGIDRVLEFKWKK
jgi:release factor glutamine methyltransferase